MIIGHFDDNNQPQVHDYISRAEEAPHQDQHDE